MDSLYIIFLKLLQTIDSLACHVECALYLYMNVIFCIMPFGLLFTIAHYKKTKKEKKSMSQTSNYWKLLLSKK